MRGGLDLMNAMIIAVKTPALRGPSLLPRRAGVLHKYAGFQPSGVATRCPRVTVFATQTTAAWAETCPRYLATTATWLGLN